MSGTLSLTLHVWRQKDRNSSGDFKTYKIDNVSTDSSFLEMLDVLNEQLLAKGEEPVVFEHDCREGICGSCGFMINGRAHGPRPRTTVCQLHMREFKTGEELWLEPWRARAFPVVRDLMVDRGALDRIIQAGGYISVNTGSAPEANATPVPKADADAAFDAATCIGCGACVAACPNASAMLFTSAKISHLSLLPQGQPERLDRAEKMVTQMDAEGFGHCSNHGECSATCPKGIPLDVIARTNADFVVASLGRSPRKVVADEA